MQLQQSRWSCFAILTLNQHRASLPCQSRNAESDDGVGNDQNDPIDIDKINKINNNANKIICHCTYQLLRALYAKIRQCWLLTCFAIFLKRSFSFDTYSDQEGGDFHLFGVVVPQNTLAKGGWWTENGQQIVISPKVFPFPKNDLFTVYTLSDNCRELMLIAGMTYARHNEKYCVCLHCP